ncbi:unnamed protein product [Phytophthora lilii]|uniref:Unnamed protein product n=1 Tax=Phytophthora lilii TaxID=2077276 RepID=A0A9W6TBA8_9STRA|nr:unnamed protein product [Phytophthora lilii]
MADAAQSDGRKALEDSPDRTSSEDELQRAEDPLRVADAGLPPKVPVKAAAKAASKAAETTETKTLQKTHGEPTVTQRTKTPTPLKSPAAAKGKSKTAGKKVAAKTERVDRRRKRKAKDASEAAGISQASAEMLFQCSCQLLRAQTLDYDVRARKMEERNAAQQKEIEDWEKRVRSLQRELRDYADELPTDQPEERAGLALLEATPAADAVAASADTSAVPTIDSSLPPAVVATEAKVQEELRKRTHRMDEFCRSAPGFITPLDEPAPRPL